ncbi:MAG: Zn-ribbon domain-containing OB-fold protein [Desulfobacterales bacterium]|nr:Zn-ribbon domain-containing OB-fold protein [Desulfobacterales bacterium]
MTAHGKPDVKGIPIREGLFTNPSEPGENAHLLGSRCQECAQVFFPPRSICSKCFNTKWDRVPLSRKGKLYTYTIIGYPAPGLSAPYAVAYIDLPEGIRVFSILTGWKEKELEKGMDMEMVIERFKEDERGNVILTYKFRPIQ